jgi:predicted DNA-binding transcriptional regulator AlpA
MDPVSLKPRLRFKDIKAAGIADSWTQLCHLIDEHDFPVGKKLSPNVRSWTVEEVNKWVESRPTDRKVMTPKRPPGLPRKQALEQPAA